MNTPLRANRLKDHAGFTLIELLVVVLIIGILAAIAIPSFLNQKSKANDASAKELARTAQTASETYATENSGEYKNLSATALKTLEPTIQTAAGKGNAYISGAKEIETGKGYEVTATSTNGDTYTIKRKGGGETERTCSPASTGGCNASQTW